MERFSKVTAKLRFWSLVAHPRLIFWKRPGEGSLSQKLPTFSDKISKNFLTYPPVWEPVRKNFAGGGGWESLVGV